MFSSQERRNIEQDYSAILKLMIRHNGPKYLAQNCKIYSFIYDECLYKIAKNCIAYYLLYYIKCY